MVSASPLLLQGLVVTAIVMMMVVVVLSLGSPMIPPVLYFSGIIGSVSFF
jgi:hypothetical protein